MADNDSDFGNFLAGFIIGGLVGAAAALLMAPQSGEETRTVIREKGIELRDRAMETAEDARARAEMALEEARDRADEALEEVRVRTDELARVGRERANELQQRGQTLIEEQRSKLETAIEAGKQAGQRAKRETLADAAVHSEETSSDLPAMPMPPPEPPTHNSDL